MSVLATHLTAIDGLEWRLTSTVNSTYLASLTSGSLAICSPHITHDMQPGQKQFSVYLANAFINFPGSEFKKYKEFLQQVEAAKDAAYVI